MSKNVETLTGYIYPIEACEKNIPDKEVEDEDEVEEEDFMEMHEISAVTEGAFQSHTRSVASKKVQFKYHSGKSGCIFISGPFLFMDTCNWWQIEVDVNMKTKKVQHTPRYRLKPNWNQHDVNQYLDQCGIPPTQLKEAWVIIQKIFGKNLFSVNEILELPDLEEKILAGGAKFSKDEGKLYKLMQSFLARSPFAALIQRASRFPHLFWKLQAILPKKAFGILAHNLNIPGSRRKDRSKENNKKSFPGPDFTGLNKAVEETPWEFAFSRVLYKKYNLSGCEAKLSDLEKSGVFSHLDDVMKDNIIVYDNLKNYCLRNGHTYINCPGKKKSSNLVQRTCKDRSQTQMFLCSDRIRGIKCEPRGYHSHMPRLFLWKYWQAEKNIALYLKTILENGCDGRDQNETKFYLQPLKNEDWETLDENQKVAVEYIRTKPLTILSGMGGCGKTTVVSKLVTSYCNFDMVEGSMKPKQAYLEPGDHCILLTAPTGKAASLLGKKCGLPACTIHSVIYSHMAWKMSKSDQAECMSQEMSSNHWKFAETKMLVVDECSMVAVTTFERLLKILLDETSLCKVVLIGDIRQLPSIEPGNFFEDIFQVASKYNLGVDLKTNHRVDAGGKSVVKNAERISLKKMPKFDEETFTLPEKSDSRFSFLEIFSEEGQGSDDALRSKARDATMERLDILLDSNWTGIRDHTTSQIITFTRSLVANANQSCCKHYNDHFTHKNNKLEFKEGDKICCRKNCKIDNPFYKPKVGDANTGAGFSDGNHPNRMKKDDVLSSEEALRLLHVENQEKTESKSENMLLSNGERENQFGISPWQQEDKGEQTGGADQGKDIRLTAEGKSKFIKFDRNQIKQEVPEVLTPMELTDVDKMNENRRDCENTDAYKSNRVSETDKKAASEPGAYNDCTSSMFEGSKSEGAKAIDDGISESIAQSTEVCKTNRREEDIQFYRIYNGDTFIIKQIMDIWDDVKRSWKPAALLDDMESDQMWVDFSSFRRTGKAEHAWCRTIHTFQGSEVRTVIYLISSCKSESWKHVYTAVTRGKEEVVIIGPRKHLKNALLTDYKRNTGLKGFFEKELEKLQKWNETSTIEDSRAEYSSLSENSVTEMGECVNTLDGTFENVKSRAEAHFVGGKDICTKNEGHEEDDLPFLSHQSDAVAKESQNDRKKDLFCTLKSKQSTSLSRTRFTELRDSQHRQDLSMEEGYSERYSSESSNSEGFNISETVTSPLKLKVAFSNQRESSFLNSPSTSHIQSQGLLQQESKILPERPKQEDAYVGTLPSPSKAMIHTEQPTQTVTGSPRGSVNCATQFKKRTQKRSQHLTEEEGDHSPDYSLKCTTPEKDEDNLGPETVASPSKSKFAFKNRRESSILNSPSPSWIQSKELLQERKTLPEKPEQDVGTWLSPSKAMVHAKQPSQTVMCSPRVSATCATQFKKSTPKNSHHLMGADSPDYSLKCTTPGKDETDLGPESEELEKLSLVSPMDTDQEIKNSNRSGARKRLCYSSASSTFHQSPAKSPKK